jgi:hypothetical protein
VAVTIKSYYDGSGSSPDLAMSYVTLAGFSATHEAWEEFKRLWRAVLAKWSCPYLHMKEAKQLAGPFFGWTHEEVNQLVTELANQCLAHVSWTTHPNSFYGACCTVNLVDYRRACSEFPGLNKIKSAEALCVDHVVTRALSLLPAIDDSPTGKCGSAELFFDRGEPFLHTIKRVWEREKKKAGIFGLIARIIPVEMRQVPAIQAADMFAWHTNNGYSTGDSFSAMLVPLTCPSYPQYLDYDRIVERCKPALNRVQ